jgi:hypothetical protein
MVVSAASPAPRLQLQHLRRAFLASQQRRSHQQQRELLSTWLAEWWFLCWQLLGAVRPAVLRAPISDTHFPRLPLAGWAQLAPCCCWHPSSISTLRRTKARLSSRECTAVPCDSACTDGMSDTLWRLQTWRAAVSRECTVADHGIVRCFHRAYRSQGEGDHRYGDADSHIQCVQQLTADHQQGTVDSGV